MTIEHPVSAPPRVAARDRAGYGVRVLAALLDGLVLYAIFVTIERVWISTLDSREDLVARPPLPTNVVILVVAVFALYILTTGLLGRTVGKLAVGLRIARADGTAPRRLRLLLRAVALIAVVGVLWWIEPLLLLVYPLWMLFNGKHQMPHDQLSDAVVVRRAPPTATPLALDDARAQLGALEPPAARVLLGDLLQLRLHARTDVRMASLPIFVLGLLALGGMAVNWLANVYSEYFPLAYSFWALAAPVGLAVTVAWFHRQRRVTGAGARVGPMVVSTIVVACAALVTAEYSLGGVITGAGFLAVAVVQRSRLLAAAAIVFGLVTGLEPAQAALYGLLEHGLQGGYSRFFFGSFENAFDVFLPGVLGLILIGAGAITFRRERIR